jgi:8-oxo-dGTP pyrophosphatase MutT (NUDIX family)
MADTNRGIARYREMLACVLRTISHHPRDMREIATVLRARYPDGLSPARAEVIVRSAVAMLETFGVVVVTDGGHCRSIDDRTSLYFLRSLAWYFANQQPLIGNWTRRGASGAIPLESLLDSAPHFLRLMEMQRVGIGTERTGVAEPLREQSVVFVLVKTVRDDDSHFLLEWDRPAGQYQLIGGRIDHNEDPLTAARREFMEELDVELGWPKLAHPRDFELELLTPRDRPIRWAGISHTYGVWTEYVVWACHARLHVRTLKLGSQNRWLGMGELFDGVTRTGERTGDPELHRRIDASISGGLQGLPESVAVDAIPDFPAGAPSGGPGPE